MYSTLLFSSKHIWLCYILIRFSCTHQKIQTMLTYCNSGSKVVLLVQIPYESLENEVRQGEGQVGRESFLLLTACLSSLARLGCICPLRPSLTLYPAVILFWQEFPGVGPWWLVSARPIRYHAQKGGENGCFLSTPRLDPWRL